MAKVNPEIKLIKIAKDIININSEILQTINFAVFCSIFLPRIEKRDVPNKNISIQPTE